jgi:hypothetical protein
VNAYLTWQYFTGAKLEFLDFWKQLAHALIHKRLAESDRVHNDGRQGQKWQQVDHTLVWGTAVCAAMDRQQMGRDGKKQVPTICLQDSRLQDSSENLLQV